MMKTLSIYLLFLLSLTACETTTAGKFFNRPKLNECITMYEVGKMACNGKVLDIPAKMTIPMSQIDYDMAKDYYSEHEYKRFMCLKYKECD